MVEVTSPKTKDYDYGTKRELYFSLPSLQHYLLVSQTEQSVGIFERNDKGWFYADRTEGLTSLANVEIPIADVYAGISL